MQACDGFRNAETSAVRSSRIAGTSATSTFLHDGKPETPAFPQRLVTATKSDRRGAALTAPPTLTSGPPHQVGTTTAVGPIRPHRHVDVGRLPASISRLDFFVASESEVRAESCRPYPR